MKYEVKYGVGRRAYFITSDCVIIWATPTLEWAIGHKYESVYNWCQGKDVKITPIDFGHKPPNQER